jgi:hypothetical protein
VINKLIYDIQDGRLGASAGYPSGKFAVIGVSEKFSDEIKTIVDFNDVEELFGNGPLRDFLEGAFSLKKQPIVYALSIEGTVAGIVSTVTAGNSNTGVGTITVGGSPRNEYEVKIIIDSSGGLNEAVFYTIIDGVESKKITVPDTPGTYEIPNTGLTLTFNPGSPTGEEVSFAKYDEFSFTTTAPKATNIELLDALEKLLLEKKDFSFIAIDGITTKDFWVSLDTRLMTEESKNRYIFAICQSRKIADGETIDAYVNLLAGSEHPQTPLSRVQVVAAFAKENDLKGQIDIRPMTGKYCGWLSAMCKEQERPGKVKLGAIPGITKIYPKDINEGHISQLDDAGYVTLCTYNNKKGIFFTRGRMMNELNSDFKIVTHRRLMDKACSLVYEKQIEFINDDVEVSTKDGSPEGLDYFKAYSEMPLNDMEKDKQISGFELTIPEGQNILSDETLSFELAIVPKGYIGIIRGTIYYKNPTLEVE